MKWQKIREQFPEQWLLVEAIKSHSEGGKRIVEDLSVLEIYSDSLSAMRRYGQMRQDHPWRECFVVHTDREDLDIRERFSLGPRMIIKHLAAT